MAQGVSRSSINNPHLIDKSTNRFFIVSLLDLSSIPRAREGGPWGLPLEKSDRGSGLNGRHPLFSCVFLFFKKNYRKEQYSRGFDHLERTFLVRTDLIKHCKI